MVDLSGSHIVQLHHVGYRSRDCQPVVDDAAEYLRDVRIHHDIPAYGRVVHSDQLHARMGSDADLCDTAPILQ